MIGDDKIEEFLEIIKVVRNRTLSKEERLQEIRPLLQNYTDRITLETMGNLTDLHDFIMERVENASAKVKEVFHKIYDLTADIDFDKKSEAEQNNEVCRF
ncbi:unnamed protein product [Cylicostephanus goldi]|uniref:Uncharacterized protein n=1 Tax=Cylicostephanus goldi TaxID=71465 RepID=A0A3P6RW26_CYLGO|nr:unnamed protein product [Cylicostephanus goldi]